MSSSKRPNTGLTPNPPAKKSKKGLRRVLDKVGLASKDKKDDGDTISRSIKGKINWARQAPPITSVAKVPQGWMGDDTDIDPDDIDANIERLEKRIRTGIMPELFRSKLRHYKKLRKESDDRMQAHPGISEAAVERIYALENVMNELEDMNNEDTQVKNIQAVIDAYENGTMDWTGDGKVSYWAQGEKIAGPKIYTDEEFLQLAWQSRKDGNPLWVEGFQGVSRAALNLIQTINPRTTGVQDQNSHWVTFWLRIPRENSSKTPKQLSDAGPWAKEIDGNYAEGAHYAFLDDTGAIFPTICKTDLKQLIRKSGGLQPPTIAWFPVNQAASNESPVLKLMLFEAAVVGPRLKDPNGRESEHRAPLTRKVLLPIFETTEKNVSGRWWGEMLYTATAPDQKNNLYVAQTRRQLTGVLPEANYVDATLPSTR